MSNDQNRVSPPVLEMGGHQWDVSILSSKNSTIRKSISGRDEGSSSENRRAWEGVSFGPIIPQAASTEEESHKLSPSSNSIALLVNNNDDYPVLDPSVLMQAVLAEEYVGDPSYPSVSEIPACLDVDDIFDKIRVSKDALNGGNSLHRVRRLSPSRYLRTARQTHEPSSPLPPHSRVGPRSQIGGDNSRFGRIPDGWEQGDPRGQQQQHYQRSSRRDVYDYQDRSFQDYEGSHQRSQRSLGANIDRFQHTNHHQYHPRDGIERGFPTDEVVVPTLSGSRRNRIPEENYHPHRQRYPEERFRGYNTPDDYHSYMMRGGDDHYHYQRHNPYEVRRHREAQHYEEESNYQGYVQPSSYSRHSQEGSDVSAISDDHLSSSGRGYRQQQTQHYSEDDRLVEVTPGTYVKLRGSAETWEAIQMGRTIRTACLSCTVVLLCIHDADMVMCPACRSISPVERDAFGGGGLGLGMSEEEARMELDRLASSRRDTNLLNVGQGRRHQGYY